MIQRDYHKTREDGIVLFRSYSDKGFCIIQKETGNLYDEAIDVADANYHYEESTIKISDYEED